MNQLVENKTFERRMMDRVKESIGDLMSDDDLRKIVEAGLKDAFFKPNQIAYNQTQPPLAVRMVVDAYAEEMKKHVAQWARDNPALIQSAILDSLKDGLSGVVMRAISNMFAATMERLRCDIEQSLR